MECWDIQYSKKYLGINLNEVVLMSHNTSVSIMKTVMRTLKGHWAKRRAMTVIHFI